MNNYRANIIFIAILILVFAARMYFRYEILIPGYEARLSEVLDEQYLSYVVYAFSKFSFDIYFWPMITFVVLIRLSLVLKQLENLSKETERSLEGNKEN